MNAPLRPPALPFSKRTLPNGLDVIVRRDPRLPLAAVNLWYHVGSKDERHGQRGYAHLFEHLMFEGSLHFPGDYFTPLQPLGASVNGSTSPDRTNYVVDLPTAHLELALAMEADRMGHLLPALTDEKLEIQKGVVTNEYRQNYANRPYGQVPRLLAEALYPPDHPYHWPTIGAMEDVASATRAHVDAFFRRFYVPSNASLCLVGDLDEDRAFALADRYFDPIPGGAPAVRPAVPAVHPPSDRAIRVRDRVELDRLHLVWHTVPQFGPDDAPLALAADLLGRGRSSRLYRRLVLERELAQNVSAYQSGRELAGTFGVVVTLRPGRSWEEARAVVDAELADLARGPGGEELARVRTGRLGALIYALESLGGFGGVADRLNAFNVYLGDPGRITSDFERFERVADDQVAEVVGRLLVGEDGTTAPRVELVVLGRGGEPRRAAPLDRSAAPAALAPVPFRAPSPERRALRCGAELWAIPRRDLPVITASLAVPAGAGAHGPDRAGLAAMTAAMLDEGTASRSAVELAERAESMATSLWASAGWDGSYVGVRCLAPNLDRSLDLAADILLNPTFPGPEWARIRGQSLAALRARRDRAESVASRVLLRALFGADHPYHVPSEGTASAVEGLDRADLVRFHGEHFRPVGSAWVVAGDLDPDAIAEQLDERLGDWAGAVPRPPEPTSPAPPPGRRILLVHRPDAPQAAVRVGHLGVRRADEDYLDAVVLNQILGGQFTSRLNESLRERKGMTYGVRSAFDSRRGTGPFAVAASVQTDRAAEALADIAREIEALRGDRPPTPRELDDARRSLLEGQARHFETPSDLVSRFAGLFVHDLPPDHHARFPERLAGVDLDALSRVAGRRLRPEGLVAVVVADAAQVLDSLERLGWGEVERVEGPED
ncbi:M16 family metallopeptidase [Tautonia plasticadhaerens]|uniref:Peptidase M16 inactive domain protein n=1 Tax=Tautonia plasticadhaerens TaxID=2527974 RepID=A0A518H3J3_9BACT|nr:pitrilysin family protein [Tautonia plasticadhaerens]QDV35425.1 Peptidase M16 inactive domain protein [Tautonia plasticadhaerens]